MTTNAGRNSSGDTERVGFLRRLLQGLVVILVLATGTSVALQGWGALTFPEITLNLLFGTVLIVCLWLLRRGNVATVVWIAAGVLFMVAADVLRSGLTGNGAGPMLLFAPITLVGLLLGRGALVVVAVVSALLVGTTYYLEVIGSEWLNRSSEISEPLRTTVIFGIMVVLLCVFLDRFALTLRESLDRSEEREADLRREMEERRRLETWLQIASDAAGVGLWNWDLETGHLEWSAKMRELMGLSSDEQVTFDIFFERVHPEDREAVRQLTTARRVDAMLPYRVVRPDGVTRWFTGRGQSTNGGSRMVGAVFDVTQLMLGEEERGRLLAQEQEAREAAESLGQRLSFLAEASHLLSQSLEYRETLTRLANLAVPRLADWCAIDVLNDEGNLERVVVSHTDPSKVELAMEIHRRYPPLRNSTTGAYHVLQTGEPLYVPVLGDDVLRAAARDDRHFELLKSLTFTSLIVVPLVSRGRALGVLIMVHSESGRHYSEEDLKLATQLAERAALAVDNALLYRDSRDLNRQLDERVKLRTAELEAANSELESFTYSASHDLRTPLRGIDGFSQALLEDYGDRLDSRARNYLARISAAAGRMGQIIDDLLKLSSVTRSPLKFESVDLTAVAHAILADLRSREPERNVEVVVEDGLAAMGDRGLLTIALENLLGNAWKFSGRRPIARVEFGWDEGSQAFFVRDNGAGFDMQFVDKLFQPFQRLHHHDQFAGTGIGLATTKRVVERLGGRVWAQSEPDQGCTFYLQLAEH